MNENRHSTPNTPLRVMLILEATTGGTGRHLVELATHLDRSRFTPSVLCSAHRDPHFAKSIQTLRDQGIPVTEVDMQRRIAPLSDLRALLRIRRQIKVTRPDIVHTHSSKAGFLGRLAARLAGSPVTVHTPHGFPFQMDVGCARRFLYRTLEKIASRWTDDMICVSRRERDLALELHLASPDRIHIVPNGIALPVIVKGAADKHALRAQLGLPNDKGLIVGAVGRLTKQKGYTEFLKAAKIVNATMPDVRFVIIGEGEQRRTLESLSDQLGLKRVLSLPGAYQNPHRFFEIMDLFVISSLWEALPYALLDAMSAGVPPVVTSVGGIPEIVTSNSTGLLVPAHDPAALARSIITLLQDEPLRLSMGKLATKMILKKYTLQGMVETTEQIYAAACQKAIPDG